MTRPKPLMVWITYAWTDNSQGDFSFLVQELSSVGVEASYDKIALTPGKRLWDQIAERITKGPLDGWAYLLTPASLESEACREELAYALDRALRTKGAAFPLIGLLHGVRSDDVPPALRIRLCVSLADPNWKEQVKAGLERRAPILSVSLQSKYVWKVHKDYGGKSRVMAVEVRPRFGEVMYWRIAVPYPASITRWGYGPAGGGSISGMMTLALTGTRNMRGATFSVVGAGDKLSPGISAYVVLNGMPEFVAFGLASEPLGEADVYETYKLI